MTAGAFQSALARLIVEPAFGRRVRREGAAALRGRPLSAAERQRLLAAAAGAGTDVEAEGEGPEHDVFPNLDQGPALRDLLARLPLTFTLLDVATSRRELAAFWAGRAATSFYLLEQAIAFCDHLLARADDLPVPYLVEIVAYERARLALQRERTDGTEAPLEWVEFEHDPLSLIGEIAAGRIPKRAGRRRCFLIGRRIGAEPEWRLTDPLDRMFAVG